MSEWGRVMFEGYLRMISAELDAARALGVNVEAAARQFQGAMERDAVPAFGQAVKAVDRLCAEMVKVKAVWPDGLEVDDE